MTDRQEGDVPQSSYRRYCDDCGRSIKSAANFCTWCGAPVEDDDYHGHRVVALIAVPAITTLGYLGGLELTTALSLGTMLTMIWAAVVLHRHGNRVMRR